MTEQEIEKWVYIGGYNGYYSVSSMGRVRNNKRDRKLSISLDKDGYCQVSLKKNGSVKTFKVHRLVAIHFLPNPKNKEQVNHINGIKHDNNITNLEWCTQSENIKHSYRKLGRKTVVKSGIHSFRNEAVVAIKGCFSMKFYSVKNCAEFMNISRTSISTSFKKPRLFKGFIISKQKSVT